METSVVPSAWFADESYRLDSKPYTSGAAVTKHRLSAHKCMALRTLTAGYGGGIYTPPIHNFSRNYVTDPRHGVRFVGSTTMLRADLVDLPLLSKRDAHSAKLMPLQLREGMTLISASGTIGKIAY